MSIIKRTLVVAGVIFCCSTSAYAGKPKAFDKYDPPSDLILTLPDRLLVATKDSQSSNQNLMAINNNAIQTSTLKRVNMDCDVNVIQNTLGDMPLTNRIFGECDLHYHY